MTHFGEYDLPIREPLDTGRLYWIADPTADFHYKMRTWTDSPNDFCLLERGIVYLKRKPAQKHGRAMLKPHKFGF